jgi:hypothetical protein
MRMEVTSSWSKEPQHAKTYHPWQNEIENISRDLKLSIKLMVAIKEKKEIQQRW